MPETVSQKIWHLLVAVNAAPCGSKLKPLNYAHKDCRELANILKDFRLIDHELEQIVLHKNSKQSKTEPTRKQVKGELKKLKHAGSEDTVLVYLNGHCMEKNGETYFCLADTKVDPEENIVAESGLPLHKIVDLLRQSPAKNVLLIIDACRSGSTPLNPNHFNSRRQNFSAILSCNSHEDSFEYESLQGSIFTYFLKKGLSGYAEKDKENYIKAEQLWNYIKEQIDWYLNQLKKFYRLQGSQKIISSQSPIIKSENKADSLILAKVDKSPEYICPIALLISHLPSNIIHILKNWGLFEIFHVRNYNNLITEVKKVLNNEQAAFIYLRGELLSSELVLINKLKIKLKYLNDLIEMKTAKTKKIFILFDFIDLKGTEVEKWFRNLKTKQGQYLIAYVSNDNNSDGFVNLFTKILEETVYNELTVVDLISNLKNQLEECNLSDKIYFRLPKHADINDILPDYKQQQAYHEVTSPHDDDIREYDNYIFRAALEKDVYLIARLAEKLYNCPVNDIRKKLSWWKKNNNCFHVIVGKQDDIVRGNINLLPIKKDVFLLLKEGDDFTEQDIIADHIYAVTEKNKAKYLYIEGFAVKEIDENLQWRSNYEGLKHFQHNIPEIITSLVGHKYKKKNAILCALGGSRAGENMLIKFGFRITKNRDCRKDRMNFYEVNIAHFLEELKIRNQQVL